MTTNTNQIAPHCEPKCRRESYTDNIKDHAPTAHTFENAKPFLALGFNGVNVIRVETWYTIMWKLILFKYVNANMRLNAQHIAVTFHQKL